MEKYAELGKNKVQKAPKKQKTRKSTPNQVKTRYKRLPKSKKTRKSTPNQVQTSFKRHLYKIK